MLSTRPPSDGLAYTRVSAPKPPTGQQGRKWPALGCTAENELAMIMIGGHVRENAHVEKMMCAAAKIK